MTPARRLALLILIILLAGAGAAPAFAGEYAVHACVPNAGDVNNSWYAVSNHGAMIARANCPPGLAAPKWDAGLSTRHYLSNDENATIPEGSFAAFIFTAPPGAGLSRMRYNHEFCGWSGFRGGLMNGAGTWLHYAGPTGCGSWVSSPFELALGGTSSVRLITQCINGPCHIGKPAHGYAAMRSATVFVADYTKPSLAITGGSATTAGWKRGAVDIAYRADDNVGINHVDVMYGSETRNAFEVPCNWTRTVPCPRHSARLSVDTRTVPDGRRTLLVRAKDAAGNWTWTGVAVNVDNAPPGPPFDLNVLGGTGWRQRNSFSITWRNPLQTENAPIAGVEYAVCPAAAARSDWASCSFGHRTLANVANLTGVTVPRAGNWVARVWLRDAAGNQTSATAQSVPLRFDDSPPHVRLGALDPKDPTRIDVLASDTISPLARAEVEVRRRGELRWLPLATARSRNGYVARLDDEHLPDGVYDLRARVVDSAGNEQSAVQSPARRVPARLNTRLVAGQVKHLKARRSRNGKRRTRRIIVVRPRVRYGRTVPIRGRLTTRGGNPVANAAVEVWEHMSLPGATWRPVALIGTDRNGRFKFKALRGPSRVLRFRYPGTALVRARTTEVEIHVRATTTFRPSRSELVNGDEIVFRGRVLGGPIPSVGKLVQLQAYSRGMWLTFATPRASARSGRWSYRYRFTSTRGTVRYRFRVRIPREAGFPYDSGVSRSASVVVRGL